jgi:hypothetical protein
MRRVLRPLQNSSDTVPRYAPDAAQSRKRARQALKTARKVQLQGTSLSFFTKRVPYPWQYAHDVLATPTAFDRFQRILRMSFPVAAPIRFGRPDVFTCYQIYSGNRKRQQFSIVFK